MKLSDIPVKITTPWAADASGSFIRAIPESTTTPGAASFEQGWPPLTFQPPAGGGIPPDGRDANGINNLITAWNRWQAAGGLAPFDRDFATAISGYPKFALIPSQSAPGTIYMATVDDNTQDPDAPGSTGWGTVGTPTGAMIDFAGLEAKVPSGWLLCAGQAVSRTTYAALFATIGTTWGAGDGTTTFNVPDMRGRVAAGADAMGGTPANRLTSTTITGGAVPGKAGGEQTHTLSTPEIPSHTHAVSDPGHSHNINDPGHFHTIPMTGGVGGTQNPQNGNGTSTTKQTNDATTGITIQSATTGVTNQNTGGGGAHNNVQPTGVVNKIIKT